MPKASRIVDAASSPRVSRELSSETRVSRELSAESTDFVAEKSSEPRTIKVAYSSLPESGLRRTRRYIEENVVDSTWYAILMTTINISNCILIGIETDCRAAVEPASFCSNDVELTILILQYVFVVGIAMDLVLQILADCRYVFTLWGIFDSVLVLASLFNAIVVQPLFLVVPQYAATSHIVLSKSTGLRVLRLLRLSRSVASFMRLREVSTMVSGLLSAVKSIAWIIILGTLITYTFAVLGVESFASADPSWSRVGETMVTLFQIATLDTWISASQPVWQEFPGTGHLFVIIYLVIVAFALMSLIIATLTERTITKSKEDGFFQESGNLRYHMERTCSYVDMTRYELEELWKDSKARACLKSYGTLDELKELFDLLAGADVSSGTVNLDVFCSFVSLYKKDKATCLSMLTLQQLRSLRRQVLGMEHSIDASHARQLEILSAASGRCAEVTMQVREEHERGECRRDQLREKRLGREGLCDLDVTKLRHMYEAADATRRGELDFIDFSSLFPRTSSKQVLDLWNSAVMSDSGTIDFDELLRVIGDFGVKKFLRNTTFESLSRPVCTPEEAGEDIHNLATKVADAAFDRVVNSAIEQAAKHAAKCVAESTFENSFAKQEPKQVTEDIADQVVQNVTEWISERLTQHVADCSLVGKQIAEELQDSVGSFHRTLQEQHTENIDAICRAVSQPSGVGGLSQVGNRIPSKSSEGGNSGSNAVGAFGQTATPSATQIVVDRAGGSEPNIFAKSLQLEKPRPPPLVFDETPSVARHVHASSWPEHSPVDVAPSNLASNPLGRLGFAAPPRHAYQRLPDAQSPYANTVGTPNRGLSADNMLRGTATMQQQEWHDHPFTPSMAYSTNGALAGLEGAFNAGTVGSRIAATIVQSPLGASVRPCLLTRMENLANQMHELN